ncbi:MAG TPA: hypothetical protein VEL74_09255 [Thermoanaerobaculia bacterium]|nr:hypothetical protein [Thermoanaerobaculia bacterium]
MRLRTMSFLLMLSLLLGFSPVSADPVIYRGIDVFATAANGKTFYDFAQRPIPAGFFCKGSKPFAGRVAFKGLPLATEVPGQLWGADTVVERLDDAVFDEKGVATTRLQFRALSLVSIAPIKTGCGAFDVYLSLGGKQRVTTMSIHRTQERGGEFVGPLAVDVRMRFVPVKPARGKGSPRKLELPGSITFPGAPMPWSLSSSPLAKRIDLVVVDTDGDQAPDSLLPGTSNFAPGQSPDSTWSNKGLCSCCPGEQCHADDGEMHCFTVTMCPNTHSCC